MKLRRLRIDRLPGIDEPFELAELGEGVNAIVGPNGIGKSSCCRAVRGLLWSELAPASGFSARALLELDGVELSVERDGTSCRWQSGGANALAPRLPEKHLAHCYLLNLRALLDPAAEPDQDLAAEIRSQMAGGFDLDGIAEELYGGIGPRFGRPEQRELDDARNAVRKAVGEHRAIGQKEDTLGARRSELREAESSELRLAHARDALELAGLRSRLEGLRRDQAELPTALAALTGNQLQDLEEHEAEERRRREQREEEARAIAAAREDRRECALDKPVALRRFIEERNRASNLLESEHKLASAREDRDEAAAAISGALLPLRQRGEEPPDLDLRSDAELFQLLREAQDLHTRRSELDSHLRLLDERDFSEEEQRRLDRLGSAVEALRAWLREPAPIAPPSRARTWLLIGGLVAVAGALLAATVHAGFAGLAGLGLGIAVAPFLLWGRKDGDEHLSEAARRALSELRIRVPAEWTPESAAETLRELEREQAELATAREGAHERRTARKLLLNQLPELNEREQALDLRRRDLAERIGLEEVPADAELVDLARALRAFHEARTAELKAADRVERHQAACREALGRLAGYLREHGEPEPVSAASAQERLERLHERDQTLRRALQAEDRGKRRLHELDGELEGVRGKIEAIYEKAGCRSGDRGALERLHEALPRFAELREEVAALERGIAHDEQRLARAGESDLSGLDAEELERCIVELEEQAGRAAGLRAEIANIEAEVRRAREGSELEEMLAREDAAEARLEEKREEALQAAIGGFLLEKARSEYQARQMPRVLRRAKSLFADFTHCAWKLTVDEGALRAFDVTRRRGCALDELSDGTRSQLLLAARLAFAEESELGQKLPIFLDEALDHSDPARFAAIARALGRIARDQERQVFYLTSDPMDVRRLEAALSEEGCPPPKVHRLEEIRRRPVSAREPDELIVEPRPAVPAPEGLTPEAYGVALGVPPLRPLQGSDAQHVFHLLRDDLALLHRLLQLPIERVGPLLGFLPTELGSQMASQSPVGGELGARCELLEVFCEAWCEGRGRPVDRDAIEASGAVSERYLEGVVELARELEGDPRALLDALRIREDPRAKRFHSAKADELEAWLLEEGFLDEREVLDEEGVRIRVLASPAAVRLPGELVGELLHLWWRLAAPAG